MDHRIGSSGWKWRSVKVIAMLNGCPSGLMAILNFGGPSKRVVGSHGLRESI